MADDAKKSGIDVYLDKVKAQTGKTWQDFRALALEKGISKHGDIIAWLKAEHGLGHGHANAVAHTLLHAEEPRQSGDQRLDAHFTGAKAMWRAPFDSLLAAAQDFGADVKLNIGKTYISLLRGGKKFGIVQTSGKHMDIGIKRPGAPFDSRYTDASAWNEMVTHRVRLDDPKQLDADVVAWLREAYAAVK